MSIAERELEPSWPGGAGSQRRATTRVPGDRTVRHAVSSWAYDAGWTSTRSSPRTRASGSGWSSWLPAAGGSPAPRSTSSSTLYQRTATHLSAVRSRRADPALVARLSALVARARGGGHRRPRVPAWREVAPVLHRPRSRPRSTGRGAGGWRTAAASCWCWSRSRCVGRAPTRTCRRSIATPGRGPPARRPGLRVVLLPRSAGRRRSPRRSGRTTPGVAALAMRRRRPARAAGPVPAVAATPLNVGVIGAG